LLPLVVIIGPTAVGKTRISIDLALTLNGEIISGDSMQVYRYMNIGTAKIKPSEMKGITHHLIDIKNPDENFSVAEFQVLAEEKIREIDNKGKLPILVGGTGLYIQSVIDNYTFTGQSGIKEYRKRLYLLAEDKGNKFLHERLALVDPVAAAKIHENDLKRIVRALEYYHATGRPISENNEACSRASMSKYNAVMIGLTMEREGLYKKIDMRVDKMMEEGLLEEVHALIKMGYTPESIAMQGLGYRQLLDYINGEYDLAAAIELIKRDTRRFAKRQLTWFRRDPRINWFYVDKYNNYNQLLFEIKTIVGRTIGTYVEN